jgi:hypothetical protein
MRSGFHSAFATLLLLIPVLAIPALAIFGIPQFAPVVASPLDEGPSRDRENGVGQSARSADGFLAELDEPTPDDFGDEPRRPGKIGDSVPINKSARSAPIWSSPAAEQMDFDSPRSDSWNNPPRTEERRVASLDGFGTSLSIDDRAGFDRRFAVDPKDSRPSQPQPVPRELRGDLVQAVVTDASAPRSFQRDSASNASASIRQVSDVREPLTWQVAIRRLNELEIRNFRLERGHRDGQFAFICSYTPSDSPRVSYRFEAEADEPMKAVEKVLQQIDEWQHRK